MLGLDAMGYWYEPEEVAALAHKYGLQAQFVPSALYPYRFHAVLSKTGTITNATNQNTKEEPAGLSMERLGLSNYAFEA